jgi:hypothetical protein
MVRLLVLNPASAGFFVGRFGNLARTAAVTLAAGTPTMFLAARLGGWLRQEASHAISTIINNSHVQR